MGSGQSTTTTTTSFFGTNTKILSRRQLLAMTEKPRDFVNQLFQVMITKLTPKELLDLGNRAQCKNYVFVMADAIYRTFDAIKVVPTKDKKTGVLFYKKTAELTTKEAAQQTYEHCLSLAYFYVRIFQIFGALALTVIDDPGAGQVLSYLQQAYKPQYPSKNIPRVKGTEGVPFGVYRSTGGGIDEFSDKNLYNKLRQLSMTYFAPILTKTGEDSGKYKLVFDTNNSMQLLISKSSEPPRLILSLDNDKYLVTKLSSSNLRSSTSIDLQVSNTNALKMTNFYITDKSIKVEKTLSREVTLTIEKIGDDFYAKRKDATTDESLSITDKLEEILRKAKDDIDKKGVTSVNAQGRPVQAVQGQSLQTDVGVTEGLYTGFLIKYLEGKDSLRALPSCVARAIQLIDINNLDSFTPQIKSHICETAFEPTTKAGDGLNKNPGLLSLNQLYFTKYYTEKKGESDYTFKLDPTDARPGEYVEFLTQMRDLFTKETAVPTIKSSIGQMKFKEPECGTAKKGVALTITDPATMNNLRKTVSALFTIQAQHAERVINFMKTRLVEIKTINVGGVNQASVKIHSNLTKGGVAELNKLAYEARSILVDYYSKCEKTYQLGVGIALQSGKV
jgi:hypothetical protein